MRRQSIAFASPLIAASLLAATWLTAPCAALSEVPAALGVAVTVVGHAGVGEGITLVHKAQRIALPQRLGFTH